MCFKVTSAAIDMFIMWNSSRDDDRITVLKYSFTFASRLRVLESDITGGESGPLLVTKPWQYLPCSVVRKTEGYALYITTSAEPIT